MEKGINAEHDGNFSSELDDARGVVLIGIGWEQSGRVSNLPIALHKFMGYIFELIEF